MNYKLNFEKIHRWVNPLKLTMQCGMFEYVCDRVAQDLGHPLASLYLALCKKKLGDVSEAQKRLIDMRQFLSESHYWQRRFKTLGLSGVANELELSLH